MGFHNKEVQRQTNSPAESLIYRHLPSSSLPLTPSVEKIFTDLHDAVDSWNPKKWMAEVWGRPTVLAVTQAAILVSRSSGAVAISLLKPTRQREGAAQEIVHSKHATHIRHIPNIHLSKDSKAPLGAEHISHHQFYRKGKQCMGMAGAEVETGLWVFKKQT